jgi:general L-amino acid transport system permease protein
MSGPIGAALRRLVATPTAAATTLLCLALLWWGLVPIVDWAIVKATWSGEGREACRQDGACWVFIRARLGQFLYGMYPEAERWRPDLAALLLVLAVAALAWPHTLDKGKIALGVLLLYPPVALWLLAGGFGLAVVETRDWGGVLLTSFMAVFGGLIAFPLGILLALGRQSKLPVIRLLSVVFIEFWRGVPIIAVIFLASLLLPLILPGGLNVDKVVRALVGLALVIAAYMAEAVRGGLQALPKGQYEAGEALGLGYWQKTALIVLPQALRISVPALVNEFIALVKNTTLVLIVSLFDVLGIVHAALADPKWVGLTMEAYAFAGAVFWIACFGLSMWSQRLEARLARERRH